MIPNTAGFALERGDNSREAQILATWCALNRFPRQYFKNINEIPANWTPVGSVVWVESILGRTIIPDYYPKFLTSYLHRKVWRSEVWPIGKFFVKPADRAKRFNGMIVDTLIPMHPGPYWISEPVKFIEEYRYYILNGQVVTSACYTCEDDKEGPELPFKIPAEWSSIMDFGVLDNGKFALVECHEPYSFGWYAKDNGQYLWYLVESWKYMKKNFS